MRRKESFFIEQWALKRDNEVIGSGLKIGLDCAEEAAFGGTRTEIMEQNFTSYRAFWPHYVSQHQNKTNRNLHFLGTTLVFVFLFLGLVQSPWFFLAMPFLGYGFAWLGHFVFERNTPATFRYPLWSLIGDFQMFAFMCLGRMDREVKRMGVLHS